MKPRALTAADLDKTVTVKTSKVEITGRLSSYTHRSEEIAKAWSGAGIGKTTIVTDLIVGGHELEGLLDGAEVTVHG